MKFPELSGALQGLTIVGNGDRDRYKAALEGAGQMGWGYYFPYLLLRTRPGRGAMLLVEDGGSICVFRWRTRDSGQRLDLYLPPIPMNVPVLRRCLERANDFNGYLSAKVLRVDAGDARALSELRHLRLTQRRLQYLFAPSTYDSLAGKSLFTIRRNVARVERLADVEVKPYSPSHATACTALLSRWSNAHRTAHGTAGGAGLTRRAIELAGQLPQNDLSGEVVFVDGQLKAFAFGGEMRPGFACSLDRKCDDDVRGLSYFHFRSFLLSLRGFALVNDGSDAGRTGLRQLKDSFRPVEMHAEYRATQPSSV